MIDRSVATLSRGLFVTKGEARPTPDYVPRLKTEQPPKIKPQANVAAAPPVKKRAAAGDGLDGLIRRGVAPRQLPEQRAAYERSQTEAVEEAREIERLREMVREHADNGLLYECLQRGLPLPDLYRVRAGHAGAPSQPTTFEEAARERISRPTRPDRAAPTATRRKLTLRLKMPDFDRFKHHADEAGRTYQDVLATATLSYLDHLGDADVTSLDGDAREAPAEAVAGLDDLWLRAGD